MNKDAITNPKMKIKEDWINNKVVLSNEKKITILNKG